MPIEETLPAPLLGAPSISNAPTADDAAKPSAESAVEAPESVVREASRVSEIREVTPSAPDDDVDEVREAARAVALRVREGFRSGAERSAQTVKQGLATAQAKLAAEERAWDARSARADFPAVSQSAPLLDLATRLHEQAGFFRELAVDAMRPTVSRHVLHGLLVMLTMFGGLLGVALIWQVITGHESAVFVPTAIIAAVSAFSAASLAGLLERSRRITSREAFTQALRAEEALEKIAVLLAESRR